MVLSRFPAGDSELAWDRTGARDQPGSPSGGPWALQVGGGLGCLEGETLRNEATCPM